jgi:hypothetical protein
MITPSGIGKTSEHEASPAWLGLVREKVGTLKFGVVQIVVHDSKVVQIERTDKTRLDAPSACCQPGGT